MGEAINGESSFEKLRDVHEGMEISISKLETVLGDTAKVERDHKAVMKLIARTGVDETALDDMVHDAVLDYGSNINNEGISGQVRFLLEQGFLPEDILQQVKESVNG